MHKYLGHPIGIGAFIGTAGDVRALLLALINGVIAFLIYFPFIKMYDKKLLKEESSLNSDLDEELEPSLDH